MTTNDADRTKTVEGKHDTFSTFLTPFASLGVHSGLLSLHYPSFPLDPPLSSRRPAEKEDCCLRCSNTLKSISKGRVSCDPMKRFPFDRESVVSSEIKAGTSGTRIRAVDARDRNRQRKTHSQRVVAHASVLNSFAFQATTIE